MPISSKLQLKFFLTCQLKSGRSFGSAIAPYHLLSNYHLHVVARKFLEQLGFVFCCRSAELIETDVKPLIHVRMNFMIFITNLLRCTFFFQC